MAATATDIGGSAENQDRGVTYTAPDGTIFAVVADGHGPHGARAAQWAVDWLVAHPAAPLTAETFALIDEHIRTRLIAHLEATFRPYMLFGRALYTPGFYGTRGLPIRGGTTLSIAAVGPDGGVRAAHVGDSDIHVFTEHEEAEGERLLAQPDSRPVGTTVSLTGDHTPTCRAEFERIRASHPGTRFVMEAASVGLPASMDRQVWVPVTAAGAAGPAMMVNPSGVIVPAASAAGVDVMLNPAGPFHFSDVREGWAAYLRTPDDAEGLAMTRALGDYNLQLMAGVSTVPHCQELPDLPPSAAGPRERVVVVASDGFWDIVHYAEAAEVIWRPENRGDSAATATALLALAKAKTLERLGAPGDNITVSVVRVLAPRPAAGGPPGAIVVGVAADGAEGPHPGDAAAAAAEAIVEAAERLLAQPAAEAAASPPPEEVAPVGGAGAPAAASHPLDDPVVWEAAVTGALPGVHLDPEDGMSPPLGRSANTSEMRDGENALIRQGVRRGTGVLYFGKGNTQRVLYCAQDGQYWDIIYGRMAGESLFDIHARWEIVGYRPWPSVGLGGYSVLPHPAPLPHVHWPAGFRPCGCPNSLGISPLNGRSASETLHGMMRQYGGCPCLDLPPEMRPAPP